MEANVNKKKIGNYYYSLNDHLGKGAFGSVYLGHDVDTKSKAYAIKVIPTSLIESDPLLQEALMKEMQVMKLLNHPNLTRCYDILSSSNNHYFVMENCTGGTLTRFLKKRIKLPEEEAIMVFTQILKGYHEMLKLGIIHRDLKPDNILIHEGVFKLCDFGFARCVDNFHKDLMKSSVGTPLYMAPQILQQQQYTTKSDLWSLAIIFYEMIFGKTPWDAVSLKDLIRKIMHEPLRFPSPISKESKDFLTRALKVDESSRMSWDEVYSHILFKDCFGYKKKKSDLIEQAQDYQGRLKSLIIEKNIDTYKLFSKIDNNKNNVLEMNEFAEFMKSLDDKISREQIEFIFNSIDENGDNVINLLEFLKWLMI